MENGKEVMEELVVPERRGVLSSTRYRSVGEKMVQETGIGFCDNCGYKLDEKKPIVICNYNGCHKKLCTSHSCNYELRRNYYCKEHIQELLPLTFHGFEILHCVKSGLGVKKAKDLAGISKEDYRAALNEVLEAEYVVKKGISVFASSEITGKGVLAWKTYFEAFKQDGDVSHFMDKINSERLGVV